MSYILFLDDERFPPPDLAGALVVRTVRKFKKILHDRGVPHTISFDHDLGTQNGEILPTGMDALHWLIEEHLEGRLDLSGVQTVVVHSANPNGSTNIARLWDSFALHRSSDVRAVRRPATHRR